MGEGLPNGAQDPAALLPFRSVVGSLCPRSRWLGTSQRVQHEIMQPLFPAIELVC